MAAALWKTIGAVAAFWITIGTATAAMAADVIAPSETPVGYRPPAFAVGRSVSSAPQPTAVPASKPSAAAGEFAPRPLASPAARTPLPKTPSPTPAPQLPPSGAGDVIAPSEAPFPRQSPVSVTRPGASAVVVTTKSKDDQFRNEEWRRDLNAGNRLTNPPPVAPPPPLGEAADLPKSATGEFSPGPVGQAIQSNFDLLMENLKGMAGTMDWGGGRLTAYAEDAEHPICIIDLDGDKPVTPASCQKILTVAAALAALGPAYQFVTPIQYSGFLHDNVLKGNLIVRGSGDPSISSRFETPARDPLGPFRDWAQALKQRGVTSIAGELIGDSSAFACEPAGPGWPQGVEGDWRCAEVSALSFNENLIEFRWLPVKAKEGRTRYDLAPRFDYVQVQNRVKIDDRSPWNWRAYRRQPASNLIDAEGWLPAKTAATDYVAIHQPVKFFMQALKTALAEEGIPVSGPAVDLADLAAPDVATSGSMTLFARQSPPLTQLIGPALRCDQNLHAELLFLALARQMNRGATFGGGSLAVGEYLLERGVAAPGCVVVDGSGLSRSNQTSAKELVAVMKMMAKEPAGDAFFAAFPQGGQPGLLGDRFQESDAARSAAPRVFAMAGFLPGVHTMAGWTTSAGGRKVYFAFLLNESRLGKSAARENLDRLALEIAQSPLKASL